MQNWNNLIDYIEQNLGIKTNFIELSREEIVNYIKEHTLREFSQKNSAKGWIVLGPGNKILDPSKPTSNLYRIPNALELRISDVSEIYFNTGPSLVANPEYNIYYYTGDVRNLIMDNTYYTMMRSLMPARGFEFYRPDLIKLTMILTGQVVVVLHLEHREMTTIPADLYHGLFKDMCMRDIVRLIIATRSKYSELATPFGNIDQNVQWLTEIRDRLDQKISEAYDSLPPKDIIAFLD